MSHMDRQEVLGSVQKYMDDDNLPMATEALIIGLRQQPNEPTYLRLLGRLCQTLERWEEARQAYLALLRLIPGDTEAVQAQAQLEPKRREIESSPLNYGKGKICQFSVHQCFTAGKYPTSMLYEMLGDMLLEEPNLAIYGSGPFLDDLLRHTPELAEVAIALVADNPADAPAIGLPIVAPDQLPDAVETVFLCGTRAFERLQMFHRLPKGKRVIDAGLLARSSMAEQLSYAWGPIDPHIYPLHIPDLAVRPGLDVLILDCPARNLALMPNGLGYVSNALDKTALNFQVLDADIILYHRHHIRQLLDEGGKIMGPSGEPLPRDPWKAEHARLWESGEILPIFEAEIIELAEIIANAKPKVLGVSVHSCNDRFSRRVVEEVRARHPEVVIIAGGYNCQNEAMGMKGFPAADYICIGEADLTVGPLCEALAAGEKPVDVPGVKSRYDTPNRRYVPTPKEHNLDRIEFPRYNWAPSLDLYRNYTGYQLTPIIASRGCRWSRCTFCAERFYWRIRSASNFCDELEWLVLQGCDLFMFNESDLNGLPERLLEICDEVIRRGIKVRFVGQLRIHIKSDRAFFDKLAEAGFQALRFGVDAFSEKTLKLQMKGYTLETVAANLRDCHEAGISVNLNWVVGVPGETDEDIDEGIEFLARLQPYIAKVENINPLILSNGSMYWLDPDSYNIKFSRAKDDLYEAHPKAFPAEAWWSEEPFIDAGVRKARFERAVRGLAKAKVPIGPWAAHIVADVQSGIDTSRSGKGRSEIAAQAEFPPAQPNCQ